MYLNIQPVRGMLEEQHKYVKSLLKYSLLSAKQNVAET